MSHDLGKDWYNYPLYTDTYVRRLLTETALVLQTSNKKEYSPEDFAHFDCMHYCGHRRIGEFMERSFGRREVKALELCSGAGSTARYLAGRYKAVVTALDFTEGLNEVHRKINKLCRIDTITVVQGDATDFNHTLLGVDSNCDLVYSILAVLHIENRAGVYRMANRALKVGGKFYMEDFTRVSPLEETEDDIEACQIMRFCSRPVTSENCRMLEDAGFQVEECTQRTREWSEFVYSRAEQLLSQKDEIIRVHGQELFSTTFHYAIWNVTKFYHDLGLSLPEVKAKYPLLATEVGEEFLQKWTQEARQIYGGSYIVATKVQGIE